jgi:hypothetical protein
MKSGEIVSRVIGGNFNFSHVGQIEFRAYPNFEAKWRMVRRVTSRSVSGVLGHSFCRELRTFYRLMSSAIKVL